MLTIWVDCAWVILDVLFCLYVEIELHSLTPIEWILGGAGLLFAVAMLVTAFFEGRRDDREKAEAREVHLREMADLRERLAVADAKSTVRFDVVTQLGVENVRLLQAATHTYDQPVVTSLLEAVRRIEQLEQQDPYFEIRIEDMPAIRPSRDGCEFDLAVRIRNRGRDSRATDWIYRGGGGNLQGIGGRATRVDFEGGDLIDHPIRHDTWRRGLLTFHAAGITEDQLRQPGHSASLFVHCQDGRNMGWDSNNYFEKSSN